MRHDAVGNGVVADEAVSLDAADLSETGVQNPAAEAGAPPTARSWAALSSSVYDLNQTILDESTEGIYGLDPNGFVTFVNQAAYRMTGWTAEDLKGRTQHSVVHHSHNDGSHYPVEDCPIYKVLREGVVQQRDDEVFWRKDGTCFPVVYTSTPVLRYGKPHGAVVVFCDITLRLRAKAWHQSKARVLRSLRHRAPLVEIAASIAESLGIFLGGQRTQAGHGIIRHPK